MKVKFLTFGCKVNQYETQALMEEVLSLGLEVTDDIADLYVVNTCSVTSRADSKSKDAVSKARKENRDAKIAVCGCLVQLNRDLVKKLNAAYIIPQDQKHFLAEIIFDNPLGRDNIWDLKISRFFNQRAFIKIQDGCDNFCSFCKIPHIRGRSVSRNKQEIISEVKRVSEYHREIVLCGVNLGLYGKDFSPKDSLSSLVADILDLDCLGRLRLSSLEPCLVDDKLIQCFSHSKLCPHVHFPFQSGDDSILKKMNKKETVYQYKSVMEKLRKIRPDIALSCDVMVGFPAETDETFSNTVEFLKGVQPMRMHIFSFSPRENTVFSGMKVRNSNVVRKRYEVLRELAFDFSKQYKTGFIGKTLQMVAEEEKQEGVFGYTENYIKVILKEKVALGQIVPVRIEQIKKDKVYVRIYEA